MGRTPYYRPPAPAAAPAAAAPTSPFVSGWGIMADANMDWAAEEAARAEALRKANLASLAAGTRTATAPASPAPTDFSQQFVGGGQPVAAASNAQVTGGDVWDGFARRYVPGTVDWRTMPGIVLHDYLNQGNQAGSRTRGNLGLEAGLSDWATNAPFIYNLLMSTQRGNVDNYTGDDDLINWMAEKFLPAMSTPGGRVPTTGQLMELLFEQGQNKDSLLYDMLFPTGAAGAGGATAGVDTEDQIDNIMGYLQTLARFSNPYMGSGMVSRANRLANEYRGQQAKGQFGDDTFLNYLADEMNLGF